MCIQQPRECFNGWVDLSNDEAAAVSIALKHLACDETELVHWEPRDKAKIRVYPRLG